MANDSHPWRDIYSNEAMDRLEAVIGKSDLPSNWAELKALVAKYHAVDKTDVQAFDTRLQCLSAVAKACEDTQGKSPPKADAKAASKFDERRGDDKLSRDAGRWVGSLQRRCGKKSGYLAELKRFHAGNGANVEVSSPQQFLSFMNRKAAQDKNADSLSLSISNRMEKIDPHHRGAELHVAHGGITALQGNPMSEALCTWLAGGQGTQLPFFMWLEGQPVCTTTPGLDKQYDDLFKARVRKVSYDCHVLPATCVGGDVMVTNLEEPMQGLVALDTSREMGKQAAEMAYVWTIDNSIYTAPHKAQRFHHSSFNGGKKVRCAGMWRVIKGKVHYIDDNSGHYRPQAIHLQKFAAFLKQKGVFIPDARAKPHSAKDDSIDDFLRRDVALEQDKPGLLTLGAAAPKSKEVPQGMLKNAATLKCPCGKTTFFGKIDPNKKCRACGALDTRVLM